LSTTYTYVKGEGGTVTTMVVPEEGKNSDAKERPAEKKNVGDPKRGKKICSEDDVSHDRRVEPETKEDSQKK